MDSEWTVVLTSLEIHYFCVSPLSSSTSKKKIQTAVLGVNSSGWVDGAAGNL